MADASAPPFGLCKRERLSSRKRIDELFKSGKSFLAFPLRVVYTFMDEGDAPAVSMLVMVAKKRFHHAVDRNLLKRRVRESFRIQKSSMADHDCPERKLFVAFLYIDTKICTSIAMDRAMQKVAAKLQKGKDDAPSVDTDTH